MLLGRKKQASNQPTNKHPKATSRLQVKPPVSGPDVYNNVNTTAKPPADMTTADPPVCAIYSKHPPPSHPLTPFHSPSSCQSLYPSTSLAPASSCGRELHTGSDYRVSFFLCLAFFFFFFFLTFRPISERQPLCVGWSLFHCDGQGRGQQSLGFCLLAGCLTSQQQASVSQGRICSDIFTCCHT